MPNKSAFESVWDAIEDTPEDLAMMKARSAERMRQSAEGAQNSNQAKWNRENFAKGLTQDNQTAPMGTSVIALRPCLANMFAGHMGNFRVGRPRKPVGGDAQMRKSCMAGKHARCVPNAA